jgi:hypothetical protein
MTYPYLGKICDEAEGTSKTSASFFQTIVHNNAEKSQLYLRYTSISYTRHFGSWLHSRLQTTGSHAEIIFFISNIGHDLSKVALKARLEL